MKNFRRFCLALVLTLAFIVPAVAGDVSTPGLNAAGEIGCPGLTASGEIGTPGVAAPGEIGTPGVTTSGEILTPSGLAAILLFLNLL